MAGNYARTGRSNPLGPCTEEIKAKVPIEIKEEFNALAFLHGQSTSEFLRDMIIEKMRGSTFVMRQIVNRGPQKCVSESGQD